MNKIYLDNSASTRVNAEVLAEMTPYFSEKFGNPSSLHNMGREANSALDVARARIAKALNCETNEIYFTSGATESNNWAIKGLAFANAEKGKHIITSCIEHPSILESCKFLEKVGFRVTYLPVDKDGLVSIPDLLHHLDSDTILISIMAANNEIGTIQHLKAISQTAKEKNVIFHSDAVQAVGSINLDVNNLGIDCMTISAHKINGPKGIGALYIKNGIAIENFMHGGEQERGRRGGTVNVAGAVGLGKAIEMATRDIIINAQKLRKLRDYFVKQVMDKIDYVKLNGHLFQRLPNNASLSFGMVDNESLMVMLDMEGICVSNGSACSSGTTLPSYVLKAIGLSNELAHGTLRFSFSRNISKQEIDFVVDKLVDIVKQLRTYSSLSKSNIPEFKIDKGDN